MKREYLNIRLLLRELGIQKNYLGLEYLIASVKLLDEDKDLLALTNVSKLIYTRVAAQYHTSVFCVERNIRTLIKAIWEFGNRDLINEMFLGNIQTCPSNSTFIYCFWLYFQEQ